mgnify:CR=1 FL=1
MNIGEHILVAMAGDKCGFELRTCYEQHAVRLGVPLHAAGTAGSFRGGDGCLLLPPWRKGLRTDLSTVCIIHLIICFYLIFKEQLSVLVCSALVWMGRDASRLGQDACSVSALPGGGAGLSGRRNQRSVRAAIYREREGVPWEKASQVKVKRHLGAPCIMVCVRSMESFGL